MYLHPATLLAALVVTGYVNSAELNGNSDDQGRAEKGFGWVFNRHDLVTYSAIVIAAVWDTLARRILRSTKFLILSRWMSAKVEHDVADLSATFQSADGDNVLGDLVSKNAQDHSLLAATTVDFEHQAITETGGNGWSFANTEIKNVVNQAPAHPAESDLPISTYDISRLEKDGDGKFAAWHSEQEQADLFQGTHQQAPVIAAKIGSSTAPSEVPIKTETHNSANFADGCFWHEPRQWLDNIDGCSSTVISSALHIDPQSLHPVVLTATSLTGAIQTTLSELNPAAGVSGSLATASTDSSSAASSNSGSLATASTDSSSAASSNSGGLATASTDSSSATSSNSGGLATASTDSSSATSSVSLFDDAARIILDQFIHDTPQLKVEVAGNDFLLVDMDRSHYGSGQQVLETWTMSDGSTLSIIGIVPHHDAVLAAA